MAFGVFFAFASEGLFFVSCPWVCHYVLGDYICQVTGSVQLVYLTNYQKIKSIR